MDMVKLQSVFDWSDPVELSAGAIEQYGLTKAVIMQEGDARYVEQADGNVHKIGTLTRDNVIFGAGGLTALARQGKAVVDIDHFKQQVPADYKDAAKINAHYPVGIILDAQAVERDGKMVVEAIMSIRNSTVFSLIKEGKIKGNSVTVHHRHQPSTCAEEGSCDFAGATFSRNSLMYQAVPAMAGTWVAPVEPDDIKTTFKMAETRTASTLLTSEFALNTEQDITAHLKSKGVSDDMIPDITAFILQNPDDFSDSHLAMLKTDWETWWTKSNAPNVKMFKMQKQIQELSATIQAPETKPEPEIEEAAKPEPEKIQMDKDEMIKLLEDTGYKVEPPQTTPQTEAPETETVEAEPESEVKAQPESEPEPAKTEPTPEPEIAPVETTEQSISYQKGTPAPSKDDISISKMLGFIGGLQSAHNHITVSPYAGQSRNFSMKAQEKIRANIQNLIYTLQNDHSVQMQMSIKNNKLTITPAH